jgi:hypothetical protein
VTTLDGRAVADGRPGPLFRSLHTAFVDYIRELAEAPPL